MKKKKEKEKEKKEEKNKFLLKYDKFKGRQATSSNGIQIEMFTYDDNPFQPHICKCFYIVTDLQLNSKLKVLNLEKKLEQ